jgi:hypothetical protein
MGAFVAVALKDMPRVSIGADGVVLIDLDKR